VSVLARGSTFETEGLCAQHIDRRNLAGVIGQECSPALRIFPVSNE